MSHFTLRDLFWLTLVVGMGCAWGMDRASYRDRYERMDKAIDQAGFELDSKFLETPRLIRKP